MKVHPKCESTVNVFYKVLDIKTNTEPAPEILLMVREYKPVDLMHVRHDFRSSTSPSMSSSSHRTNYAYLIPYVWSSGI